MNSADQSETNKQGRTTLPDSTGETILTADKTPAYDLNPNLVPAKLKALARFIGWILNGNIKEPIDPVNGHRVSVTDPKNYGTFEAVFKAVQTRGCGLGFCFNGDGLIGIDIDDCRDPITGEIASWALYILQIVDSYAEISPSKTGVKIFVFGTLPNGFRSRFPRADGQGCVEVYSTGRYFTVTSNHLAGTPTDICERNAELQAFCEFVTSFKPTKSSPLPPLPQAVETRFEPVDDRARIEAALGVIDPNCCYEDWLNVLMACHSYDSSGAMLATVTQWSRGSDKFVDGECESKWKSFSGNAVGIGTLFKLADNTGRTWRQPSHITSGMIIEGAQQQQIRQALHAANRQLNDGRSLDQVIATVTRAISAIDATGETKVFETLTSQQLDEGDFPIEYFIPGILVAGQPGILAGPKKCLKTNILIALVLALASMGKFLGEFLVNRAVRVALISGESGKATIQETARRIAKSMPWINLKDYENAFWCFDLPKLGQPETVKTLIAYIRQHSLEMLILDPIYLCLPIGDSAGNLFLVGQMLADLNRVTEETGCTILLCHHTRKNNLNQYEPPELESIAWAGFQEFARQWILLGRREAYNPDNGGQHALWLTSGGSAGHGGLWAVDITEGTQQSPNGRRWDVSVRKSSEAKREEAEKKTEQRTERDRAKFDQCRDSVLKAYQRFPNGETAKVIRELVGLSGIKFPPINISLLDDGLIEACKVLKGKRDWDGFRIKRIVTLGTAEKSTQATLSYDEISPSELDTSGLMAL